jgi:hypothetical protein
MSRRWLSFTEKRRARLALKVDRLERMESRSTVTPFTAFSLAAGAFQGLAQMGLMPPDGGNGAAVGRGPRNRPDKGSPNRARPWWLPDISCRSRSVPRRSRRRARGAEALRFRTRRV